MEKTTKELERERERETERQRDRERGGGENTRTHLNCAPNDHDVSKCSHDGYDRQDHHFDDDLSQNVTGLTADVTEVIVSGVARV